MQIQKSNDIEALDIPDSVLVRKTLQGNNRAFQILMKRYSPQLYRWIRRYLRDDNGAMDILQEVFFKLYVSLAHLDTSEPLKPWLYRVARNCCIDALRKQRSHQVLCFSDCLPPNEEDEDVTAVSLLLDPDPLPAAVALQHEVQQQIQQAILALPPPYRAIVSLRYTTQATNAEIAQRLHMPVNTVRTYFRRALPLLRDNLHQERQ